MGLFKLCTTGCTTVQTEGAELESVRPECSRKERKKPRNFRRWFMKKVLRRNRVGPEPFIDEVKPRGSVANIDLSKLYHKKNGQTYHAPTTVLRPVASENLSIYEGKLPLEIQSDISISTVSTVSMDLSLSTTDEEPEPEDIHGHDSRNLDGDTPIPGTPLSIEGWSTETDSEGKWPVIFVKPVQSVIDQLQGKLHEVAEQAKDDEVQPEAEMNDETLGKSETSLKAEDEVTNEVQTDTEATKPQEEIVYKVRVRNRSFWDVNSMPEVPYRYESFRRRGPRRNIFQLRTVSSVKHAVYKKKRDKPLKLKEQAAHVYAVPAIARLTEKEKVHHHEWVQKAAGAGTKGELAWYNQAISFQATFPGLHFKFRQRFKTPKDAVRVGAVPQDMQIQVLKLEEGHFPGIKVKSDTCDPSFLKWNLDPDSKSTGSSIADKFRKFW